MQHNDTTFTRKHLDDFIMQAEGLNTVMSMLADPREQALTYLNVVLTKIPPKKLTCKDIKLICKTYQTFLKDYGYDSQKRKHGIIPITERTFEEAKGTLPRHPEYLEAEAYTIMEKVLKFQEYINE